jgi:hypothetical protein
MEAKQASPTPGPTKPVETPQNPENNPSFAHYNTDP